MEIRRAIELQKSVLCFIREATWADYERLRNSDPVKYIEASEGVGIRALIEELAGDPSHPGRSNWWNSYKNVVDLAPLVKERIVRRFPEYAGSLALAPDRLVRMTWVYGQDTTNAEFFGVFRNLGLGPALDIRHGIMAGQWDAPGTHWCSTPGSQNPLRQGGLREGERLCRDGNETSVYRVPGQGFWKIVCQYENRFGDLYRVEMPVACGIGAKRYQHEELYVGLGTKSKPNWIRID